MTTLYTPTSPRVQVAKSKNQEEYKSTTIDFRSLKYGYYADKK